MIEKFKAIGSSYLSDYLIALILFAAVFFVFNYMQAQQEEQLIEAMQTIERIKLKIALTEE